MELIVGGVRETNLKLTLAFGIGIHHAGLTERDRKAVEELFVNQKIQVGTTGSLGKLFRRVWLCKCMMVMYFVFSV